jgi:hypothetical protein
LLDPTNPSVLTYARTAPTDSNSNSKAHAIVISLNFTAQPQTIHLDLTALTASGISSTAVKTLLTDAAELQSLNNLTTFTLPPYASLVAEVQ